MSRVSNTRPRSAHFTVMRRVAVIAITLGCAPVIAQSPAAKTEPTATTAAAAVTAVVTYAQRYAQSCAACHGTKGEGAANLAPALAGQPSFYAITQLFLFKNGRRTNEAMLAIAKDFSNDDLRGFSDFIGKLPALDAAPAAGNVDANRIAEAGALVARHQCHGCHGADLAGAAQVPRLAGQHEDYLQRVLSEFRTGQRLGYTSAMNEALAGLDAKALDALAYYLARFRPTQKASP